MKLLTLLILIAMTISSQAQTICSTTSSDQVDYSKGCIQIEQSGHGYSYSSNSQKEKEVIRIIGNDIYEISPSGQINKKIGQVK